MAGSSRRPRLKTVADTRWSDKKQTLTKWLAERGMPGRQISLAVPSSLVHVRSTILPLTNLPLIRRTIKFHAERLIPGISPDDAGACITGEALEGTPFEGCDVIRVVPGGRHIRR